jgi:hypothetical protein
MAPEALVAVTARCVPSDAFGCVQEVMHFIARENIDKMKEIFSES